MRSLFLLLTASIALGCSSESAPSVASDNDVIGGVDATSHRFDAIGAILNQDSNGKVTGLCSASLIAPTLVLTAKHCVISNIGAAVADRKHVLDSGKVMFRIGADIHTATPRDVAAKELYTCAVEEGGSAQLGCDVAIYRLAEAVTDITPLAVATTSVPASYIGRTATVFGFGGQATTEGQKLGTRKLGTETIRAVDGAEKQTLFESYTDYLFAIAALEGAEYVNNNPWLLESSWKYELMADYEVAVGGKPDNAQTCPGDSGGPLVLNENGTLTIYGVDSTGNHGVKVGCQNLGSIYATFGPEAQKLIQGALAE